MVTLGHQKILRCERHPDFFFPINSGLTSGWLSDRLGKICVLTTVAMACLPIRPYFMTTKVGDRNSWNLSSLVIKGMTKSRSTENHSSGNWNPCHPVDKQMHKTALSCPLKPQMPSNQVTAYISIYMVSLSA